MAADLVMEGERKEPPPRMQEMMKEMDALTIGEPVFFDLRDPWLHAPSRAGLNGPWAIRSCDWTPIAAQRPVSLASH